MERRGRRHGPIVVRVARPNGDEVRSDERRCARAGVGETRRGRDDMVRDRNCKACNALFRGRTCLIASRANAWVHENAIHGRAWRLSRPSSTSKYVASRAIVHDAHNAHFALVSTPSAWKEKCQPNTEVSWSPCSSSVGQIEVEDKVWSLAL